MEFILNTIFFLCLACIVIYDASQNLKARYSAKKGCCLKTMAQDNNVTKDVFSSHDIQVYIILFSILLTVRNCTCKYVQYILYLSVDSLTYTYVNLLVLPTVGEKSAIPDCLQEMAPRWRRRRDGLRRWMTPQAQELSTELWQESLKIRTADNYEFVRPFYIVFFFVIYLIDNDIGANYRCDPFYVQGCYMIIECVTINHV